MLGHINDDLAFLYEIFITESLLNRRMAENLSRLLFTYRIQVEDPSIRYVLVYHEELKKEEKCPLKNGRANVQIYTENHRIFLEDENGNRYESSVPYTIKNMLTDIRFREYCLRLAPDSAGLLLNICSSEKPDRETVPKYAALLEMEEIRETYRKKLRQELLDFYCQNPGEESLYEFLHEINLTAFAKTDRYHLTDFCLRRHEQGGLFPGGNLRAGKGEPSFSREPLPPDGTHDGIWRGRDASWPSAITVLSMKNMTR